MDLGRKKGRNLSGHEHENRNLKAPISTMWICIYIYISPLALPIPNILKIQKVHVSRDTGMSQHDFPQIFQSKDEHPVTSIITSIIFENARIIHYDTRISSNIPSIICFFKT